MMPGLKSNHTLLNQDSRYREVACTQFLDTDNRERGRTVDVSGKRRKNIDF